jgi:hypothetical protein
MQKTEPMISKKVEIIRKKIENDIDLSYSEKSTEVAKTEAAYLLSAIAGWKIKPEYLKQLVKGEKPRLRPHRVLGNVYIYLVGDLLKVKFTSPHKPH